MNNCKDSVDGRHEFIVIGWKFRANYRTANHFMCNKCMRLFEFEKISDRHARYREAELSQEGPLTIVHAHDSPF